LLQEYRTSLKQIRETGYVRYAVDQFRPYLFAALSQFSPSRQSLTERLISMAAKRKTRGSKRSRTRPRKEKSPRQKKKKGASTAKAGIQSGTNGTITGWNPPPAATNK